MRATSGRSMQSGVDVLARRRQRHRQEHRVRRRSAPSSRSTRATIAGHAGRRGACDDAHGRHLVAGRAGDGLRADGDDVLDAAAADIAGATGRWAKKASRSSSACSCCWASLALRLPRAAGGQPRQLQRGDTYTLTARFDNIGGLKVRAPVKSAGVTVGRVTSITLDPKTLPGARPDGESTATCSSRPTPRPAS